MRQEPARMKSILLAQRVINFHSPDFEEDRDFLSKRQLYKKGSTFAFLAFEPYFAIVHFDDAL